MQQLPYIVGENTHPTNIHSLPTAFQSKKPRNYKLAKLLTWQANISPWSVFTLMTTFN